MLGFFKRRADRESLHSQEWPDTVVPFGPYRFRTGSWGSLVVGEPITSESAAGSAPGEDP